MISGYNLKARAAIAGAFLLLPFLALAGGFCGTVSDSVTGAGLARATLYVPEQHTGTVTDETGNFCLQGITLPCTVKISYIGYHAQYVEVKEGDGPVTILLVPEIRHLGETVITASRYEKRISDLPSRMAVVDELQTGLSPAQNSDDLLRLVPNIYVNRNQGIFSRSAGLTMRGLSGTARTLVMVNGVPLNKTAGGSITWNIIRPEEIERVEVLKGPASSVYGNNAMSGAINIITKKPAGGFDATARVFGGTYATHGAEAGVSSRAVKEDSTVLFFAADAGFRKGDGYYLTREEDRDTNDAKVFLDEYHAHALAGLEKGRHRISLDHRFYDGTLGEGREVFEPQGSHDRFVNNLFTIDYHAAAGAWQVNAKAFLQHEMEERVSENINQAGKYKLSDNVDRTLDYGLWASLTRSVGKHHTLSAGVDVKAGTMDSELIYRTTPDRLDYGGEMLFTAVFVRDDLSFGDGRWNLHAGLRLDRANFSGGFLRATDPTSATGFLRDIEDTFSNQSWHELSPHAGIRYAINGSHSVYVSYGRGFMPPKLDDLSRSGKISKGFKIANPALQPETVDTWEAGWNLVTPSGFQVLPTVYYSLGHDFQYFVSTGDSIDTGGSEMKPVLQRRNISEVAILGAEIEAKYYFRPDRYLYLTYAYNHTEITGYPANPDYNKDLEGNELIEVPAHLGSAGIFFSSKFLDLSGEISYTGDQWYDDGNTVLVDGYTLVNLHFQKEFLHHLLVSLSVENLFDVRYLDRKGYRAPGRFIIASIQYSLKPQIQRP